MNEGVGNFSRNTDEQDEFTNLYHINGPGSFNANKELTWEELNRIERRRRDILRRSEMPYGRILVAVEGTCLRGLSRDWLLWLTMSIFLLVRAEDWFLGALPAFAKQVSRLNIEVIGGFLSFFLVLFVNQSNARFQEMYKESMTMVKRIHDVASIVHHALPIARAKRIVRYMNAAHAAAYVGLNDTYTSQNFFAHLNAKYRWLSAAEMERIVHELRMDHNGPSVCHEVTEWCLHDVDTAHKEGLLGEKDYVALRDKITQFRCAVDTIYDYCDQPIHFFYIHFLVLLSALYLPLFAITQALKAGTGDDTHWLSDFLSGVIVFLQAIFVIGLRMLGRKMIDPYGSDLEDLSVLHYIQIAWDRSHGVFSTKFPAPVSSDLGEEPSDKRDPQQQRWSASNLSIV